jgi:hypothetical protein
MIDTENRLKISKEKRMFGITYYRAFNEP